MAKCDICNKTKNWGNKISIARSHVSRRTSRTFEPNVRSVKMTNENGEAVRLHVCAKCLRSLRSGKITNA